MNETLTKDQVTEQIKLVARYKKAKKIALALVALGANSQHLKNIAADVERRLGAARARRIA